MPDFSTSVGMRPRYLTVGEVANELRVSRTRVLQILKEGRIPYGRVAGKRLIPATAITKFIRDRCRRECEALRERRRQRELAWELKRKQPSLSETDL
jgi:excisionase family DNA binding protein